MSKGSGLAPTGQAGAFFALRRKETPGTLRKVPGVLQYGGGGVMRNSASGDG